MQNMQGLSEQGLRAAEALNEPRSASSSMHQPILRIARTISEVEDLRQVWTSWLCYPSSDIDFYLMKIRSSTQTLRPHVMVVYHNGLPDCMLVGRLDLKRLAVNIGYVRCYLPKARVLAFIRGGFLGKQSSENCELLTRGIVDSLRSGEADVAELKNVRVDSPLYCVVRSLPGFLCRDHVPVVNTHGSLRSVGTFEEFWNGLCRKHRHNLKRQARSFLRKFAADMEIRCFWGEDELERLIYDAEEVAKKTYQRTLGVGFADSAGSRQQLKMAAERKWLRGYVMYIAHQPCAFIIGLQYRETLYTLFMGFDPKYSRFSPGSVLLMRCIQDAFTPSGPDRLLEIDLGPGDQRFKLAISNNQWQEGTVGIFAPTPKGVLLNLIRTTHVIIARFAHGVLAETDLGKKTKRLWRAALSRS
jgi:hypothetical protein